MRGRFVLPELPAANYKVWVRGYGLVDSTPIEMKPGRHRSDAESGIRQDSAGSGQGLSRRLLALDDGAAREESVPGHGSAAATAWGWE